MQEAVLNFERWLYRCRVFVETTFIPFSAYCPWPVSCRICKKQSYAIPLTAPFIVSCGSRTVVVFRPHRVLLISQIHYGLPLGQNRFSDTAFDNSFHQQYLIHLRHASTIWRSDTLQFIPLSKQSCESITICQPDSEQALLVQLDTRSSSWWPIPYPYT